MTFWDDIANAFNPVKILDRGVKAVKKIGKGIKREGERWIKGRKREFKTAGAVLKEMGNKKVWEEGARKARLHLQTDLQPYLYQQSYGIARVYLDCF